MASPEPVARIKRQTQRRKQSTEAWHQAIRDAHAAGVPIRRIGQAAGISHVHVLRIVRGDP